MKAITAFELRDVKADLACEKNGAQVWQGIPKRVRGAAERIIEAVIVVMVAAIFITAVMRVHESCQATACFNEAIAKTVLTVGNVD